MFKSRLLSGLHYDPGIASWLRLILVSATKMPPEPPPSRRLQHTDVPEPQGVSDNGAGNTWFVKISRRLMSNSRSHARVPGIRLGTQEDATVWMFNLREGVKWHDGEDFTASASEVDGGVCRRKASVTQRHRSAQTGPSTTMARRTKSWGSASWTYDLTLEIELTLNPRFYDSVRAFYALRARYRFALPAQPTAATARCPPFDPKKPFMGRSNDAPELDKLINR